MNDTLDDDDVGYDEMCDGSENLEMNENGDDKRK